MSIFSRLFGKASDDDKKGIIRYEAATGDPKLPRHTATHLDEITAHVEKHWGKVETVFHELI